MIDPVADAERCAVRSLALAEPSAGTAGPAARYVVIEHAGAWGRDAVVDNDLDPALTAELLRLCEQHRVKPLMMRRPGRTRHRAHPDGRTIYAAVVAPDRSLVELRITDPAELAHLAWDCFDDGDLTALHESARAVTDPVALVCAHAKRDRCCAIGGRPVAAALSARFPGRVWECSHLGGHRFSPTALMLPAGAVYARLDPERAGAMYAAARCERVIPEWLRGLSRYSRPVQAADIAVRTAYSITGIDDLDCVEEYVEGDAAGVLATMRSGRSIRCRVEERRLAPARPESCGKPEGHPRAYVVTSMEPG